LFAKISGFPVREGAVADFTEVRDVVSVEIHENREIAMTLLFDHEANLEERVFKEQFMS